jgi:hypothetical protein
MSRALWLVLVSAAALGLATGCGSSSKCKKACEKMQQCALGDAGAGEAKSSSFNCPFSATCNPKEECQAACYLAADCPAILSKAGAALTPCLQQCATIKTDGGGDKGPGSDGPIKLDKGGPCTPQCGGRVCGPNGCGGNCGGCTPPMFCNTYGQCINNCTPNCAGRQCGGDGCGGSCGSCAPPTVCNTQGQCYNPCSPNCSGKVCGDNGCGGSCGSCTPPLICDPTGQCVTTCTPACSGKQCGPDGCGGSCGSCTPPASCSVGVCGNKTIDTGQICTNQNLCKQPADTCLFMATGAVKGICLTNCNKIGDPCSAPNPGTQFAACGLSDASGHNYCGFYCEILGTSYACPNSFDFDCKALDPTAPTIKLCIPKP